MFANKSCCFPRVYQNALRRVTTESWRVSKWAAAQCGRVGRPLSSTAFPSQSAAAAKAVVKTSSPHYTGQHQHLYITHYVVNFISLLFILYHDSCVGQLLLKNFMMMTMTMMMMLMMMMMHARWCTGTYTTDVACATSDVCFPASSSHISTHLSLLLLLLLLLLLSWSYSSSSSLLSLFSLKMYWLKTRYCEDTTRQRTRS